MPMFRWIERIRKGYFENSNIIGNITTFSLLSRSNGYKKKRKIQNSTTKLTIVCRCFIKNGKVGWTIFLTIVWVLKVF